jgi:signal transduction histidine kinase
MASLGELTAGIAHEIQNPLNFVNNFSEVTKELAEEMERELEAGNLREAAELAKELKENVVKILLHGKRAEGIVKGMLQHATSSSGTKEAVDLNSIAEEYLQLTYQSFRTRHKGFDVQLLTDFDQTLEKINVYPMDMVRVLVNLFSNAFYAMFEKKKRLKEDYTPQLRVSTKGGEKQVLICVADNGTGIPLRILHKIYQPFFTTKPTGEGTGLGLSLSYDIITKAHGGEIKVESAEGEGSTFLVQLPCR